MTQPQAQDRAEAGVLLRRTVTASLVRPPAGRTAR